MLKMQMTCRPLMEVQGHTADLHKILRVNVKEEHILGSSETEEAVVRVVTVHWREGLKEAVTPG